jgi:acetylcholinesterase
MVSTFAPIYTEVDS